MSDFNVKTSSELETLLATRRDGYGMPRGFYHDHREKGFFESLVKFMSSGPLVAMVLEREGAIATLREVMGATDPAKATEGTIRKDFASSIEKNIIHGSDSPPSAEFEIGYFFSSLEICRR